MTGLIELVKTLGLTRGDIVFLFIGAGCLCVLGMGCLAFMVSTWLDKRCKHEWETVETVHVDTGGINDYDRYFLRCKKCGNMKCKSMK